MELKIYRLQKGAKINPAPWHGLADALQQKEAGTDLWIEAELSSPSEIKEQLRQNNIHPLIIEDCLNPEHSTLIDRYPEALYIELPTNADAEQADVAYLSIICIPSVIFTIRRGRVVDIPRLMTTLQEDPLEFGNTGNLLYKLIDFFIERTVNQGLIYRQQTNRLEEQLKQEPETIDPDAIAELRQHMTQLEFICEDQVFCAKSLVSQRNSIVKTDGQEAYFNDLVTDSEHALRSINRLNGRLKDLQDHLELKHQDSVEKRIRMLTILSAIFLPLTFITGYFGMNFRNMTILNWPYSLTFFSILLFAIPAVMLWFFYSRGWFD